ncbi:response regulator transcription factor [Geodermatophilus sp. SYSU D00525]
MARRPGPVFPWALLDGLLRLVPCDVDLSYQVHDVRDRQSLLLQGVMPDGTRGFLTLEPQDPDEDRFWQLWCTSTCSWPQRTGDLRSVVHTGDFFPTDRARLADPMHAEVLTGCTAELMVSLPAPPGEARRLLFNRWDRPFTERDRSLLELARPHVLELLLDAERRRAGVPPLTPREWEVLALFGAGLSREEVAGALWLSVGTVRKHAEHIREKCGTHTVAEAAARALPHAPSSVVRRLSRPGR